QWHGALEALLLEHLKMLEQSFDTAHLAQPDQSRFRGGVYDYRQARRLVGSNDIFEEFNFRALEQLESGSLVFVDKYRDPVRVLPLAPLVRLDIPTTQARSTCYFLNSRTGTGSGMYTYVSYHDEDEPRVERSDPALDALIRGLEGTLEA